MAGFNSKYDFAPRLENPEETEEIDQNSLEEICITEFELACLDVCYKSPNKGSKTGNKNAFKIEGVSNFTVKIIPNSQKKKKLEMSQKWN